MTTARGWGRSAALVVLAGSGQAASLALINAPPYAVYQHFSDWDDAVRRSPLALLVLGVQAAVVLALAWPRRRSLAAGLGRLVGGWKLAVLLAAIAFSAAVPTESAGRTLREVALAVAVTVLGTLTLALAVTEMPAEGVGRAATWLGERLTLGDNLAGPRRWDRRFPWLVAAWVVLASALISWHVFERLPHIDDSVSYLFQAKTLAMGRLWLPAPPDSAAFHVDQVIVDGARWYGYGFPGWPALLAAGVAVGIPWLVNPLLAGLTVLLSHALVARLYDRAMAHWVAVLLAFSPWLLFISGELMSQPLAALLAVAVLLAVARARERPGGVWGAAAGALYGAMALTRPLDAAFLGLVAAAWALGVGARRLHWRDISAGAVVSVATGSLLLPYNAALTGSSMLPPHTVWVDRAWGPGVDRLGFGADVGIRAWPNLDPLPGHGPADVVLNFNKNAFQVNADLFGWACGSLLLCFVGALSDRGRRADAVFGGIVVVFAAGYSLYWFSGGPDFGARYWYPALVPFVVLTVRGARAVAERLAPADDSTRWRVYAFLAAATACAAITFLPWRAATKYYRYRGVSGDVRELAARHHFGRALVLVRSPQRRDYQSAFSLNPADFGGSDPVYAWDAGPSHREAVLRHFPTRPVWVIGRPDPAVARLDVLAGPFPPGTIPPWDDEPKPRVAR